MTACFIFCALPIFAQTARVGRNDGVCYVPPMLHPSLGFANIQANIPFYNYANDTEHPLTLTI